MKLPRYYYAPDEIFTYIFVVYRRCGWKRKIIWTFEHEQDAIRMTEQLNTYAK